MKKAILLLFLMLALLFGNRTTSSAQTATTPLGSGTIGDPYLIASLENLYWIANQANNKSNNFSGKYFIQTADIDASSTSTWFSGAGWTPISGTTDFFGSYNGQGHIISGLHINRSSTGCIGLFGTVGTGTIQNLGLTNVSITGSANVGGLIGYLWNAATVSNCYTTGSVTATDQCCGGLIGKDDGAGGTDNNTVSQCYSGCTVSGTDYTGGLIGQAFSSTTTFGTITDCYATGAVTSSGISGGLIGSIGSIGSVSNCHATGAVTSSGASGTGGLIGSSGSKSGTVNNCYATGNVTATLITSSDVGGLIGVASSTGTVSNCYATGAVTAGTTYVNGSGSFGYRIGGLIGHNSSAVSGCFATGATYGGNYVGGLIGYNEGTVNECYSTGTATDNGYIGAIGGLIGQNQNTVNKCYSISSVSTAGTVAGFVGNNSGVITNNNFWNTDINIPGIKQNTGTFSATGKTTAEMQTQSTFTGWDFTTIWARTDTKNNKYPYLAWQTGYLPTLATTVGNATSTTSINLGGNITDNGNATVTERGVVYSSSNTKPMIGGAGVTKTIIGSGSGSFSSSVSSLAFGTTYYIQSYATNSMGTSYGGVQAFAINAISSIARSSTATTNASSVSWTVTFANPVTGLTASNFSLANTGLTSPTITNVAGFGITWTVTANTGSGNGSLGLNLASSTGLSTAFTNTLPFTGEVYTIDKTAPVVSSINKQNPTTNLTNANSITYRVSFSKNVSGVDISDFSLTTTGTCAGTIASVSAVSATVYDITVNSISGNGTSRLDLNGSGTGITDNADNVISGGYTSGEIYTIDKTAPVAPTISGISSGYFNTNQSFTVSGETGATIEYSTNNGGLWTAYSGAVTLSTEGTYNVLTRQTDQAGNGPTASGVITLTIDKTVPATPTISGISTGYFNTNQSFTVSGESGATIEYSTNNGALWTAYSGAVTLSTEGTYNVLARQTDRAGNGPISSSIITLTIDKTAPAAPVITGISTGHFSANQTFTISGESGATIEYSTNNGGLWTAYSGAVTLSTEGTYNVLARQTDQTGNGPTASSVITLTIDKTAPAAPTISGISTGNFNTNQTFTISGEAGATVEYSTNNGGLLTAYSGAVTLSTEGTYNVLARQTDQAGNGPISSSVITLTIDKTAPAAPVITGISTGNFSANQTFTISGETGATVEYSTNNGGLWTAYSGAVTLSTEGTYNVLARQTDQAGNGQATSDVITLTIDKTTPVNPTILTQAVSDISSTTATGNGNIISLGIPNPIAYGVCWNTTGTPPTTSDSKVDKGAASATGVFIAFMTGLSANTTYYVRAFATNSVGTVYGDQVSFTSVAVEPTTITNAASSISATGVTLNGSINANNASTTVTFEYGLTTGYGTSVTAGQSPVTGILETSVSKVLTGLMPNTTYHFRVKGANAGGIANGLDQSFITSVVVPTATSTAASSISATGASLNGSINANNASTTVTFEYGLTIGYGTSVTADQNPVTGSSETMVNSALTGLTPNTTYHFRVKGVNAAGTATGNDVTFTTITVPDAPTIGTAIAGDGQATVSFIAPTFTGGSAITGYTVTSSPGNLTATGTASPVTVNGLTNGTAYTFTVTATNRAGTSAVSASSNTVNPFGAPLATTTAASAITTSGATLNGTMNANGASTVVCFEYGLTPGYGTTITADQSPVTGADATLVSTTITGLTSNTSYHYRVVGVNSAGTIAGSDQTFTTAIGTGLDETTMGVLSLYPNPASEGFYIYVGEKKTRVYVSDLSARLVLTQEVTGKSYINISTLPKGVYIVKSNGLVVKLVKK